MEALVIDEKETITEEFPPTTGIDYAAEGREQSLEAALEWSAVVIMPRIPSTESEEPNLNRENLRKVIALIMTLPDEKVDMNTIMWASEDAMKISEHKAPECKTVGCIAGWTAVIALEERWGDIDIMHSPATKKRTRGWSNIDLVGEFYTIATKYLGLSERGAYLLFHGAWHPKSLYEISRTEVLAQLRELDRTGKICSVAKLADYYPGHLIERINFSEPVNYVAEEVR